MYIWKVASSFHSIFLQKYLTAVYLDYLATTLYIDVTKKIFFTHAQQGPDEIRSSEHFRNKKY